jgi:hypothetical protein
MPPRHIQEVLVEAPEAQEHLVVVELQEQVVLAEHLQSQVLP